MLAPKTKTTPTPPTTNLDPTDLAIMQHAIREAQLGFEQGMHSNLYHLILHGEVLVCEAKNSLLISIAPRTFPNRRNSNRCGTLLQPTFRPFFSIFTSNTLPTRRRPKSAHPTLLAHATRRDRLLRVHRPTLPFCPPSLHALFNAQSLHDVCRRGGAIWD